LVTGPTGEGKSTTIAAIINEINMRYAKHILTIEDPIEYLYPQAKSIISQREIGQDTHSWSVALKSALREDPDIVVIGEMRDYDTIQAALTIAETGHLVFSTLHTNSVPQTIDRIVDVFPPRQQNQVRLQLASSLKAVVSQRLVPTIDQRTRIPAIEVLIGNPAVSSVIRENKTHLLDNIIETSSDQGMIILEKYLANLYFEGKISRETALFHSIRPVQMQKLIK
jgi:twitching motility protein PilT